MILSKEIVILIINAIAYIAAFFYYVRKYRTLINLGTIILGIFSISSIGSIWYYTYPWTPITFPNITLTPLIFLFVIVLMCTYPLLKFNLENIVGINDCGIKPILVLLSTYFAVFSIVPFCEILLKCSTVSLASSFLGQMYESNIDKAEYFFSPIGSICFSLIRHFGTIPILTLFYLLTQKDRKHFLIYGNTICVLLLFMFSFLSGSRGGIIGQICAIVFYLFIFRYSLPKQIFSSLKKCLFVCMLLVVVAFSYISISRAGYGDAYQSSDFTIDKWLSSYLGMGFLYFSDVVWHLEKFANGDQNFALLKTFFNSYRFANPDEYYTYMENYLGTPLTEFYTNIGDIYCDFGRIGTIIFAVLFCLFQFLIMSNTSRKLSFCKIIIIYYAFSFMCYGFAANVYRTIYAQQAMIFPIIIGIFISLIQLIYQRQRCSITHSLN